jgi:hypothetical protein
MDAEVNGNTEKGREIEKGTTYLKMLSQCLCAAQSC